MASWLNIKAAKRDDSDRVEEDMSVLFPARNPSPVKSVYVAELTIWIKPGNEGILPAEVYSYTATSATLRRLTLLLAKQTRFDPDTY